MIRKITPGLLFICFVWTIYFLWPATLPRHQTDIPPTATISSKSHQRVPPLTMSKRETQPTLSLSSARRNFAALAQQALRTLPKETEKDMATLIPRLQPLITANKIIKENPELVDDGLDFYRQCATSQEIHLAVRARCLSHFLSLSKQYHKHVNTHEFDERLVKVAEIFPENF